MKLLWSAGGWNEHFERLEGLLFGHEDWQNDWWIAQGMERGRYAGHVLCCAVNAEGLKWLDAAGFRALPPVDHENLNIRPFDWQDGAAMKSFMMENEDSRCGLLQCLIQLAQGHTDAEGRRPLAST